MTDITIITPCSRPENLEAVAKSINFDCKWVIVFDCSFDEYIKIVLNDTPLLRKPWINTLYVKGGVSGNAQRNLAIDSIHDGFIYCLDDDNLMHPEFYEATKGILANNPDAKCIFYSQDVQWRHIGVRAVNPSSVRVNGIDQAQFLISRELIGKERYQQKYEADGLFIQKIFKENDKSIFYFYNDKPVTYYNRITYEKNRTT